MLESGEDRGRAAESVLRAIDFVERRFPDDIGVQDMADEACYSIFYFSRLFARATGHAPYDYLMRRRVAIASEPVISGAASITQIALDHGFEVLDTFARAFRRCFGLSPSEARRTGSYPRAVARTRISRSYVEGMLAEGLPVPEAEDARDMVVEGSWRRADGAETARDLRPGIVIVAERDGELISSARLVGVPAVSSAKDRPAFPLCASSVPGGKRCRFRMSGPEDLARVVEFAYRAWLPAAGFSIVPSFDIIEMSPSGESSLVVPLPTSPPLAK